MSAPDRTESRHHHDRIEAIRALLRMRRTASLATLHAGGPAVSLVPWAALGDGSALVVHVSRLAAHTQDMLADARVAVLIAAAEDSAPMSQAVARLSIIARAEPVEPGSEIAEACAAAYFGRFPDAAPMAGFGDFGFFALRPERGRWVGGFADAHTLDGVTVRDALRA